MVAVHGLVDAQSGASNQLKVLIVPEGYVPAGDEDDEEDEDLKDLMA